MRTEESRQLLFDIRGQICPAALLVVLKEVNRHRKALLDGSTHLVIRTDNRDSTTTIPGAVSNMGYAVEVEKIQGYYQITVLKQGATG